MGFVFAQTMDSSVFLDDFNNCWGFAITLIGAFRSDN